MAVSNVVTTSDVTSMNIAHVTSHHISLVLSCCVLSRLVLSCCVVGCGVQGWVLEPCCRRGRGRRSRDCVLKHELEGGWRRHATHSSFIIIYFFYVIFFSSLWQHPPSHPDSGASRHALDALEDNKETIRRLGS